MTLAGLSPAYPSQGEAIAVPGWAGLGLERLKLEQKVNDGGEGQGAGSGWGSVCGLLCSLPSLCGLPPSLTGRFFLFPFPTLRLQIPSPPNEPSRISLNSAMASAPSQSSVTIYFRLVLKSKTRPFFPHVDWEKKPPILYSSQYGNSCDELSHDTHKIDLLNQSFISADITAIS